MPPNTFPEHRYAAADRKAQEPASPSVTVLIINYNGRKYLDELLNSLRDQVFPDFKTVLMDNASTDDSVQYVRNNYPWVEVVSHSRNLGFSRAANRGAMRCNSTYFALLNPDMRLEPDWLQTLVDAAETDGGIAAVASKIRLHGSPGTLNGVGGCMNRIGYTWDRGMYEEDHGQYDEVAEVFFASAGAALFRRELFFQVGRFDEHMFMYHEDVDFGWRCWLLGHRIVTAPRAVTYHHFAASTRASRGMEWREKLGERHNIRSLIKNYERANLLKALKDLVLLPQRVGRKLQMGGNFLWNLWHLRDTLRQRQIIQASRARSDRELMNLIVESRDVPVRL